MADDVNIAEGNPNRTSWKLNCWAVSEEVKVFNVLNSF